MELLAKDIEFAIGDQKILKGISMTLEDKEIIGIIGPNGSGKSTFLKCVYRILHPTAGTITLNGRKLDEMSYRESALQMAVVAQHNQYSFDFTVMDIVLMGRMPHKRILDADTPKDYEIARAALAKVGMEQMETRSFLTLSGGEQQRVVLARALTQESECLILDEPTNHLDIKFQLETMEIVRDAHVTSMIAVHDLNLAAQFCHRLIAVQHGEVVAVGTPKDVLTEAFVEKLYGVKCRVLEGPTPGSIHIMFTETIKE